MLCVCLVCMATNAVYLYLVNDMRSKVIFVALQIFSSRKGMLQEVNWDWGINFADADKIQRNLISAHYNVQLKKTDFIRKYIMWRLNLPGVPHYDSL